MASLPWPAAAKFLLLGLTNVVIGVAAMQFGRWWALFGTLAILAAIPTVMAIITPAAFAWALKIGRAHVLTPVTNAHLVCRLLLEKKKQPTISTTNTSYSTNTCT